MSTSNASATVRPTKKQREILGFIEDFIKEHGYSPSYREIMTGLDYTSVATVSLHINSLIRRGHLAKRDRSARSLEIVRHGTTPSNTLSPAAKAVTVDDRKSSEELWLEERIDALVMSLTTSELSPENVLKLEIVHEATKLLGLQVLADETGAKLTALQARLAADQSV